MAADAWTPYEAQAYDKGKGKGKGHPVAPEPAATGVLIVGATLLTVALVRWRARRATVRKAT